MQVSFIGIGASRSGSTWLSQCLSEHPNINFSTQKETHFFDDDTLFQQGTSYYHHFFADNPEHIAGEFTPGYCTDPRVAKRIAAYNPAARLIFIARNPVARAHSEYHYNRGRELEIAPTFSEALEGPLRERYLKRGCYATLLQPFLDTFPREQICILSHQEIENKPAAVLKKIFTFLDVDSSFIPPSLTSTINASSADTSINYIPGINRLIHTLRRLNKNPRLSPAVTVLKWFRLNKLARFILRSNTNRAAFKGTPQKIAIDAPTQTWLDDYYQEDMKKFVHLSDLNPAEFLSS